MATAPTSRSAASRVALCSNTDVAPTFSVCCASLREAGCASLARKSITAVATSLA